MGVALLTAISLTPSSLAQSIDMYGNISFQRAGESIALRAEVIENYRALFSVSGTLALQLWACSAPFTGGTIVGHKVAEANLGTLQGGYYVINVNRQVPFYSPPTGSYFMVLVLAEWDWGQFKTVDWQNFQGTQSFFASYSPILPTHGLLTSKFLGSWKGVQVVNGQQQFSIDAIVTRLGVNGFSLKATYNLPGLPQSDSTELYYDDGTIQGYANVDGQLTSVFNGRWFVNGNTITADYDIAEINFSYSLTMVYTLQSDTTITMSGSYTTGDTISGSAIKQGITPLPTPEPTPPIAPAPTFIEWALLNGLTGDDAAPNADPDHDGLVNLVEYYMGLDPTVANVNGVVLSHSPTANPPTVSLIYQRSTNTTLVTGTVEWEAALTNSNWSDDGVLETTQDTGAHQNVTATVTNAPGETVKFLRLRVRQN